MKTIRSVSFVSLKTLSLLAAAVGSITLCAALSNTAVAQTYNGNLSLMVQADVNAFNYTEVTGDLTIGGGFPDITDLSSLAKLTRVGGSLILQFNENLEHVDGLTSLGSVGGDLQFWNNESILDVNGLAALTSVGGSLIFYDEQSLTNLYGLASLATVGGSVFFEYASGPNVRGATALTSIGGNLEFSEVDFETLDGLFPKLTTIGGDLVFSPMGSLRNLNGLSALTSVGGRLILKETDSLENVDGLASLNSVGGILWIDYAPNLPNLDGLSHLTSVGGPLTIEVSDLLGSLNGLASLSSVGGPVTIQYNTSLNSFCGLYGLLNGGKVGGAVGIVGNAANPTAAQIIAAGPCFADTDGDGIPDSLDACPTSDLRPTVWVLNLNSRVPNRVDSNGCSLADKVSEIVGVAVSDAKNHGQFVNNAGKALNILVQDRLMTQAEELAIANCVARVSVLKTASQHAKFTQ